MTATGQRTWTSVAIVAFCTVATVLSVDAALHLVHRPVHRREVVDAVRDYRISDPTTLVLGSSHARTFVAVGKAVAERTSSRERILAVPVEWGKYSSYLWVLQNRLRPFIDEPGPDGSRARKSLRRFVLLTAWWDASKLEHDPPTANIPSRAWSFADFVAGVARSGLDEYSRNYLTSRFLEICWSSVLVNDRGLGHATLALRDAIVAPTESMKRGRFQRQVDRSLRIVREGIPGIAHPDEMKALGEILDFAAARGLETTVVLYPIPPSAYDAELRARVLDPSNRAICTAVTARGVRCIDRSYDLGTLDTDFMADLDHLNESGDAKFTSWALANDLAFLLDPAR